MKLKIIQVDYWNAEDKLDSKNFFRGLLIKMVKVFQKLFILMFVQNVRCDFEVIIYTTVI